MKLRTIICASAVAAAASASALTSTNTFARLPVTSAPTNAIIALPFSGCGESEMKIYVTNLVMTSNLEEGDMLLHKTGSATWEAWTINSSHQWTSAATSTRGGISITPPASATACWLYRKSAGTFYLYGQVNATKRPVQVAAGTSAGPTYTIVGCPYEAGPFNVKGIANAAEGDTVMLMADNRAGKVEYTYTNGAWKVWKQTAAAGSGSFPSFGTATYEWAEPSDSDATVPAGCGFMYGRKAASSLTINW